MNKEFFRELIEEYYNMGLYTDEDLNVFVPYYISEEQKQEMINKKKNKEK